MPIPRINRLVDEVATGGSFLPLVDTDKIFVIRNGARSAQVLLSDLETLIGGGGGLAYPRTVSPTVITGTTTFAGGDMNKIHLLNTTSAAFSVTIPATATISEWIGFADAEGTWGTNNITVNSINLHGTSQVLTLDVSNSTAILTYTIAATGYILSL